MTANPFAIIDRMQRGMHKHPWVGVPEALAVILAPRAQTAADTAPTLQLRVGALWHARLFKEGTRLPIPWAAELLAPLPRNPSDCAAGLLAAQWHSLLGLRHLD